MTTNAPAIAPTSATALPRRPPYPKLALDAAALLLDEVDAALLVALELLVVLPVLVRVPVPVVDCPVAVRVPDDVPEVADVKVPEVPEEPELELTTGICAKRAGEKRGGRQHLATHMPRILGLGAGLLPTPPQPCSSLAGRRAQLAGRAMRCTHTAGPR